MKAGTSTERKGCESLVALHLENGLTEEIFQTTTAEIRRILVVVQADRDKKYSQIESSESLSDYSSSSTASNLTPNSSIAVMFSGGRD